MRRSIRVILTAASAIALALTANSTVSAAPERGGAEGAEDGVLVAMQRDLGLTATQAKALRTQQAKAVKLDASLRASLGSTFGGSWFDAKAGKLVVTVTDKAKVVEVTKAGARAVVVDHSEADLLAVTASLDALSGKASGATRAANGKSSLTGLAGWHVDPKTNSVVVTAIKGQQQTAARNAIAKFGDAVRFEETDRAPTRTADYMDGGDAINFSSCSAGFNLRNPSTGQGYLLTAGHCTAAGQANYGQGSVYFGPTVSSWFPTYDDALIRNDNPGYWIQGPWVDYNPSNGGFINVSGHSDSPVGTVICKSGITTLWTCGYITVKRETVVYNGDPYYTVYGLTRHSACVEPGDSGGANVAALSVWSPEGVTSGASLYWDGSRYRCGQVFGAVNVSWYYPIGLSLPYYSAVYGVTTW
ncbi:S1 family peptidase [Actinophytocola sp.]|uniref:S1 family peptidase n=1 Tax=Actinophytocola sp. TaxID=1872138 RepID=UPI002ED008F7